MKIVGYFVVGEGNFGLYEYGRCFVNLEEYDRELESGYWTNRGYEFVEVFVKED